MQATSRNTSRGHKGKADQYATTPHVKRVFGDRGCVRSSHDEGFEVTSLNQSGCHIDATRKPAVHGSTRTTFIAFVQKLSSCGTGISNRLLPREYRKERPEIHGGSAEKHLPLQHGHPNVLGFSFMALMAAQFSEATAIWRSHHYCAENPSSRPPGHLLQSNPLKHQSPVGLEAPAGPRSHTEGPEGPEGPKDPEGPQSKSGSARAHTQTCLGFGA